MSIKTAIEAAVKSARSANRNAMSGKTLEVRNQWRSLRAESMRRAWRMKARLWAAVQAELDARGIKLYM